MHGKIERASLFNGLVFDMSHLCYDVTTRTTASKQLYSIFLLFSCATIVLRVLLPPRYRPFVEKREVEVLRGNVLETS